jgi:hypothetical protein
MYSANMKGDGLLPSGGGGGGLLGDREFVREYGSPTWWKTHTPVDLFAIGSGPGSFVCDAGVDFYVDDMTGLTVAEVSSQGMRVEGVGAVNKDIMAFIPDLVESGGGPVYSFNDWVWVLMTFATITHSGSGYSQLYLDMSGATQAQLIQLRRAQSGMQGRNLDAVYNVTSGYGVPGGNDIVMSVDFAGFTLHPRWQRKTDGVPAQPSDVLNDFWTSGEVTMTHNGTVGQPVKANYPLWDWNPCHGGTGAVAIMEGLEVFRHRRA